MPFYCDATQVGHFAVAPAELTAGSEEALFKLFVSLSMFQALRDVIILKRQLTMPASPARLLTDLDALRRAHGRTGCALLEEASTFDAACGVRKVGETVDCDRHPGRRCPVKAATTAFKRTGDMGKLPTSAWLHFWRDGGLEALRAEVMRLTASPTERAGLLVDRLARVYRFGRKLATLYVSALSTPALAPGLTPWFPWADGNELVVVDTNVARAIDHFGGTAVRTYEARTAWLQVQAGSLDLQDFHPDVPSHSPRLVQQALYWYCSKSNRAHRQDACSTSSEPCLSCVPGLCPFQA